MFEGIIEQTRLTGLLENALLKEQVSHAYLFTGPKGIGKKTIARGFAAALRCTASLKERPCGICRACRMMQSDASIDVLTVTAEKGSKTIKIKQIRDLIGRISEKTFDGNIRICYIFGAECMTIEAQNALLKSLEEPSGQNIFLMTSDNPEKLLPTIRSRCQVMALEPLSDAGMKILLEKKDDPVRCSQILCEARGIPGRALELQREDENGTMKKAAFLKLFQILKGDPMPAFELSEQLGKEKDFAAMILSDWILGFESILRAEKTGVRSVYQDWDCFLQILSTGEAEKILDSLFLLSRRLESNVNARLQWEAALLKIYRQINNTI